MGLPAALHCFRLYRGWVDKTEEVGDPAGHQQPSMGPLAKIDIAIRAGIYQQKQRQRPHRDAFVCTIGSPIRTGEGEQQVGYQQQDDKQDQQDEDLPTEAARHRPVEE